MTQTSTIRQHLTSSAPPPSQPTGPSRRDVQRDALRDLVQLATESAASEARIEQQYQAATETASKEREATRAAVATRYAGLFEQVKQKDAERRAAIEAEYASELEQAKNAHQQARRKIDREHEPIDQKTRKQLEHAIWLADSVLEVAQNQVREENKKTRELLKSHSEALADIELRGLKLLNTYGQQPPPEPAAEPVTFAASEDLSAEMTTAREAAEARLRRLGSLTIPRLFVGPWPWVGALLICAVAGIAGQASQGRLDVFHPQAVGIAVGGALVVAIALGLMLRTLAKNQVRQAYMPLRQSLAAARQVAEEHAKRAAKKQEAFGAEARRKRDAEVKRLNEKASPVLQSIKKRRAEAERVADAAAAKELQAVRDKHDEAIRNADTAFAAEMDLLKRKQKAELDAADQKFNSETQGSRRAHDEARVALAQRLRDGLANIQGPMGDSASNGQTQHAWADPYWATWNPPKKFPALVRFGELAVNLQEFADRSKGGRQATLELPPPFEVPASLAFPRGASLLVQHDRTGRPEAIRILQTVMTGLLTSLPPGRARFTILDPVGLGQNFAGFMHLADHDEALVGARIWTETDQIEQRLADMTEHMETVIQKYLRNEFATIDEYNAQAGELAEPYRFLVIADFPTGFQGDAFRRLASIVSTGARCGVYVLLARDTRVPLSSEANFEDIESHCVNIVQEEEKFVWKDDVFGQFPLKIDSPPPEGVLTGILDKVGRGAKESKRVEVSFDTIAPEEKEFWTGSTRDEVQVPIGRMGATRLQALRLGKGMAQHVLIAGKTGSGKSTLLHAMVTNLAMWYSPDEIELYLIDFKKGVEFKAYATQRLPHARAIAVESDREFGVSVLGRLDAELARRAEIFRKTGVQDLSSYRKSPDAQIMPRTLLIIDEFQEFFSEDDKLAQDATLLLDRLVRQGRAFGVHVLLGSQTIGGSSGLARSTISQMGVRIALQTSEADSQLILGDNNSAARLLSRPGEAIYNDAGGLVEANSPFQVAWLSDERREQYLEKVSKLADAHGSRLRHAEAIVFEGNAPADVQKNAPLLSKLRPPRPTANPTAALAWLGEPVAIEDPTAITFRRQSGANIMLIGQQEEQAMAVMLSAMISLATQYPREGTTFYVMDGTPADSYLAGTFEKMKSVIPNELKMVEYRGVEDAMTELEDEMRRRQEGDPASLPEIYVFIYGLQRYRALRKSEDEFSFSMSSGDEPKKANTSKQFADLLREGPNVGIHVITWIDTATSLDRTLDRTGIREFDNRVLFQMSANDSSQLIDSPAANKLGSFRALSYSEEQGVIKKFRPYSLPTGQWLQHIATSLGTKTEKSIAS